MGSEPHANLSGIFTGSSASERYIGITVRGLSTTDVEFAPRLQLLAAPYSFLARNAVSLVNDQGTPFVNVTSGTLAAIGIGAPIQSTGSGGNARGSGSVDLRCGGRTIRRSRRVRRTPLAEARETGRRVELQPSVVGRITRPVRTIPRSRGAGNTAPGVTPRSEAAFRIRRVASAVPWREALPTLPQEQKASLAAEPRARPPDFEASFQAVFLITPPAITALRRGDAPRRTIWAVLSGLTRPTPTMGRERPTSFAFGPREE